MSEAERIRAGLDRLVGTLSAIEREAKAMSAARCPYRDRHDACTFSHGCRNQRADAERTLRCAGGTLNPLPARPEDIEARG